MVSSCITSPSTLQRDRQRGAHAAGQLVGGDEERADRGGGVPVLALQPLAGAELPVAAGDVVEDREAGDRGLGLAPRRRGAPACR